jgi:prepilin-type processing-associated H-X9-DG protein
MAVGVDGPALVGTVRKLVEGLEHPLAWTRANLEARREIGASLEEFLGGFNGTVLLAVTPGTPFPAFTLAIPANQAVDLAVQGLLAKALRGAPAPTLDELRQAAVPLPMPGPAPVQPALRRSTSHWIIGSDALLVDGLATGAPGGFDAAKAWPEAKGACLLAYQDTGGLARTAAGFLPMAAMQVPPEQRPLLQAVTAALAAAAPLLEPSTVSGVAGPQGLRLEGRNALATLALPAVAAGLALPAINETRRQAQRTAAGNNMRHQVLLCQLWRNDHDDLWPADLQLAIKEYGDDQPGLAERLQRDPANPGIARPYLYVRPAMNATSLTPALVQDPACNQGEGSMVCYADGHVRFVRGTALWAEAQRLAPTPKAAQKGLERSDWTVPVE